MSNIKISNTKNSALAGTIFLSYIKYTCTSSNFWSQHLISTIFIYYALFLLLFIVNDSGKKNISSMYLLTINNKNGIIFIERGD